VGLTRRLGFAAGRVYHGTWGHAPFQSVYAPSAGIVSSLALMPEMYLIALTLWGLTALAVLWLPMLFFAAPALLVTVAPLAQALASAGHARFREPSFQSRKRLLTASLHLLQPAARLTGRVRNGLTLWRRRGTGMAVPLPSYRSVWSEEWRSQDEWLTSVGGNLRDLEAIAYRGGEFDRWDFEVYGGLLGGARVASAVEEHGAGRQLMRFRAWPRWPAWAALLVAGLGALATMAALDGAYLVAAIIDVLAALVLLRLVADAALAMGLILQAIDLEAKR
jgi:hypothetical protein